MEVCVIILLSICFPLAGFAYVKWGDCRQYRAEIEGLRSKLTETIKEVKYVHQLNGELHQKALELEKVLHDRNKLIVVKQESGKISPLAMRCINGEMPPYPGQKALHDEDIIFAMLHQMLDKFNAPEYARKFINQYVDWRKTPCVEGTRYEAVIKIAVKD